MIKNKQHVTVIPGFSLSLGITLSWTGFIIIIPLMTLFISAAQLPMDEFVQTLLRPAAIASFRITFAYAFLCATINVIAGTVVAWTLTRYPFRGSKILDALVDLPFALPGAVGGIALASVFGKTGIIGSVFARMGVELIYNQFGILIGLVFITLPFAVRSIQPLIIELDKDEESAAQILGASPLQTFLRVQLPCLKPGMAGAFILSFARAIGEYGTVIFVAGNIPHKSEVVSRYIYNKIDQYDIPGATAIATTLLLVSLLILTTFRLLQRRGQSYAI